MNLLIILSFLLCFLCFETDVHAKVQGVPGIDYPNYSSIPKTSFKCSDQLHIPGFYADIETKCQVFYHCYDHRKESFLCPVGTIFNQAIQSCDYWYSSECNLSPVPSTIHGKNTFKDTPFLSTKVQDSNNVYQKMAALYDPDENSDSPSFDGEPLSSQDEKHFETHTNLEGEYVKSSNKHVEDRFEALRKEEKQMDSNISENVRKYNTEQNEDSTISKFSDEDVIALSDDKHSTNSHQFNEMNKVVGKEYYEVMNEQLKYNDLDLKQAENAENMLSDSSFLDEMLDPHEILLKRLSDKEVGSRKKLRRKPKYVILQTHDTLPSSNEKYQESASEVNSIKKSANVFSYEETDTTTIHHLSNINLAKPTSQKSKRRRKVIAISTEAENEASKEFKIADLSSPVMTSNVMDPFIQTNESDKYSPKQNDLDTKDVSTSNIHNPVMEAANSTGEIDLSNNIAYDISLVNVSHRNFVPLKSGENENKVDNFLNSHESGAIDNNYKENFGIEVYDSDINSGRNLIDSFDQEKPQTENFNNAIAPTSLYNEYPLHKLNENSEDQWVFLETSEYKPDYDDKKSNLEFDAEDNQPSDLNHLKNVRYDESTFSSLKSTQYVEENENSNENTMYYNPQFPDELRSSFPILPTVADSETYTEFSDINDIQENSMEELINPDSQLEYPNYEIKQHNSEKKFENEIDQTGENILDNSGTVLNSEEETSNDLSEDYDLLTDMPFLTEEESEVMLSEKDGFFTEIPFISEEVSEKALFNELEETENVIDVTENQEFFDPNVEVENLDAQENAELPENLELANDFLTELDNKLQYENYVENDIKSDEKKSHHTSQIVDPLLSNVQPQHSSRVIIPESHYAHSELEKPIDAMFHSSSMPLPTNSFERHMYLQNVKQDTNTGSPSSTFSNPSFYRELEAGSVSEEDLPDILQTMYDYSQSSTNKKSPYKNGEAGATKSQSSSKGTRTKSLKTTDKSEFSTSPFFDNHRSINRLSEMFPLYLSEIKRNEMYSSRMGKISKPAKLKKLIEFGKKLLKMKRAKLNIFKKFVTYFISQNF